MRIISRSRLKAAVLIYPKLRSASDHWYHIADKAIWTMLAQTRATFPSADQVRVASGRIVTIFNLTSFRLITAIHYNRKTIYILRVLTHAEYDRDAWKNDL